MIDEKIYELEFHKALNKKLYEGDSENHELCFLFTTIIKSVKNVSITENNSFYIVQLTSIDTKILKKHAIEHINNKSEILLKYNADIIVNVLIENIKLINNDILKDLNSLKDMKKLWESMGKVFEPSHQLMSIEEYNIKTKK